jgi:hypothetical protein
MILAFGSVVLQAVPIRQRRTSATEVTRDRPRAQDGRARIMDGNESSTDDRSLPGACRTEIQREMLAHSSLVRRPHRLATFARHLATTSSAMASVAVTRWCKGCTGRLFPLMIALNVRICSFERWMGDFMTIHFTPSEQGGVVNEPS